MKIYVIESKSSPGGNRYHRYRSLFNGHTGAWHGGRSLYYDDDGRMISGKKKAELEGEAHAAIVREMLCSDC